MSFKIVGIGELLWDLLPGGKQLGGAPANFAFHARALGADALPISRVGDDALGRQALDRLRQLGVPCDAIERDPERPTGTVDVVVAADGQPCFTIHEGVAWDALCGEPAGRAAAAAADALCFGTLAQRSEPARSSIRTLVESTRANALRVFDINLRQHYFSGRLIEESLALTDVLKLNETELPCLAELFGLGGDDRAQMVELARRYELQCVALTRGSRGSVLYSGGRWSEHVGIEVAVVDAVGAGDAFTAAMTLGLLRGWDLDRLNSVANQVAAFVASRPGATPDLPNQFRRLFHR